MKNGCARKRLEQGLDLAAAASRLRAHMEEAMVDKFLDAVRAGKSDVFSIDPENPAMAYDSMDIYSAPETRVRFTGYGGYSHHQEHARKFLTVDGVYTIERTEVGGWHTDVFLKEFPGEGFNSVMFAAAPESPQEIEGTVHD